jgi:hypothetical protein
MKVRPESVLLPRSSPPLPLHWATMAPAVVSGDIGGRPGRSHRHDDARVVEIGSLRPPGLLAAVQASSPKSTGRIIIASLAVYASECPPPPSKVERLPDRAMLSVPTPSTRRTHYLSQSPLSIHRMTASLSIAYSLFKARKKSSREFHPAYHVHNRTLCQVPPSLTCNARFQGPPPIHQGGEGEQASYRHRPQISGRDRTAKKGAFDTSQRSGWRDTPNPSPFPARTSRRGRSKFSRSDPALRREPLTRVAPHVATGPALTLERYCAGYPSPLRL